MTAWSRLVGAAAAGQPHHGEREHAFAVAGIGRALVPVGGLRIVALDAEPVGIELAQHRHRLGVAVILRARDREIEGRLVEAALIGAVDVVDVRILEGGRRRGGGRWRCRGPGRYRGLERRRRRRRRCRGGLFRSRRSLWLGRLLFRRRRARGRLRGRRRQRDLRGGAGHRHQQARKQRYGTQEFHGPALSVPGLVRAGLGFSERGFVRLLRSPARHRSARPWRRAGRPR